MVKDLYLKTLDLPISKQREYKRFYLETGNLTWVLLEYLLSPRVSVSWLESMVCEMRGGKQWPKSVANGWS